MVTLKSVSKAYSGAAWVLNQINLELKKGDFMYVVGGSGVGKSTLLRLLATEEVASTGSLKLFGYDLKSAAPSTLRAIRQVIGYVPQESQLIRDLSVQENILLSLKASGRGIDADSKNRLAELLNIFGLTAKCSNRCDSLSGGERQRVAVARALIRAPELIVADEPTGAQDRDFTWAVMERFLKSNLAGATVILATHDREIVRRVRKPCFILADGRLKSEETACFF